MHAQCYLYQNCTCFAGSGHVYQLEELVALVPRREATPGESPSAWSDVCRLPASHQQAIDEVPFTVNQGNFFVLRQWCAKQTLLEC